jgi:arylsulfatase A-like enzyme
VEGEPPAARPVSGSLMVLTVWFGTVMGLVEGVDLLLFQRINWANWGRMIHVDGEIIWVSPLVDLLFCGTVALLFLVWSRLRPRSRILRNAFFLFTGLTIYDWLTATQRLYQSACILVAFGAATAFARWFDKHQGPVLRFFKRTSPWLAAFFVLAFVGVRTSEWASASRIESRLPDPIPGTPNVLVIILDTLRADHVSAYGYARNTTPEIDHMAREGVLFENAISPSSWSLPSHVSLVTGHYLHDHGWGNVQPAPWFGWGKKGLGGLPCIGEAFQDRGYRTAAFSANTTWFVGNLGFARCFQHFDDYFYSPTDAFSRTLWGTEILRNYGRRIDKHASDWMLRFGRNFGFPKVAGEVNKKFFHWLDQGKPRRPFFVYFNYLDVHAPYGGPPGYPKPGWDVSENTGAYDAGVKYVDDQIRALVQGLKERGLAQDTVIIVTSDHGEGLWQHGVRFHVATLYGELIRVPLVIWYPGKVPAGLRIARPVSTTAIPATLLSMVGGAPGAFPGPPLTNLWTKPESAANWPCPLAEVEKTFLDPDQNDVTSPNILTAYDGSISSIVAPQWQVLHHTVHGDQIFDWVKDPGEIRDVINTPEGKQAAQALGEELRARSAAWPRR